MNKINYAPEDLNKNTKEINDILEMFKSLGYKTELEKFEVNPDFQGDENDPYFVKSIAFQIMAIREFERIKALIESDLEKEGDISNAATEER